MKKSDPSQPTPEDEELKKNIGIAMGLVYRESTKQWLMDVIQPGDEEWHIHHMTSEVNAVFALIKSHAERETAAAVLAALTSIEELVNRKERPTGMGGVGYPMVYSADITNHITKVRNKLQDGRATAKWEADQDKAAEIQFLKRLKLEFDANRSECAGEPWADSDAAVMVNDRLADLLKAKKK